MDLGIQNFNNSIILILMLLSSIGIVVLCTYVFVNSHSTQVFVWFELWMGLLFLWNWTYMIRQVAPTNSIAWILLVIEVMTVAFFGPVIICFARAYRGRDNRYSWAVILAFFGALGIVLVVVTNPMHHNFILEDNMRELVYGRAYYLSGIFVYSCFLIAMYYFLVGVRNPSIYWKNQLSYVGGSVLVLMMAATVQAMNIFDTTMNIPLLMLPFSLILIAIAVMKYQFLDILPYAMSESLNVIDDGYMVFGTHGELEDYNKSFFDEVVALENCLTMEDVLRALSGVIDNRIALSNLQYSLTAKKDTYVSGELIIRKQGIQRHLQYTTKAINDTMGLKVANLITFHDMTELHKLYTTLEEKKVQLLGARERLEHHIETVQLLTVETERNRLMSEVHDTLGHSMAEVLALLEQGEMILGDSSQDIEDGRSVVTEALKQSRSSLAEIRLAVDKFRKMGTEV